MAEKFKEIPNESVYFEQLSPMVQRMLKGASTTTEIVRGIAGNSDGAGRTIIADYYFDNLYGAPLANDAQIDGQSPQDGDIIAVNNCPAALQNGIYIYDSSGDWILKNVLFPGALVSVLKGDKYGHSLWITGGQSGSWQLYDISHVDLLSLLSVTQGNAELFAMAIRDGILAHVFELQHNWEGESTDYVGYELTNLGGVAPWVIQPFGTSLILNARWEQDQLQFVAPRQGVYHIGFYSRYESNSLTIGDYYIQLGVERSSEPSVVREIAGKGFEAWKVSGSSVCEMNGNIMLSLLPGERVKFYARNMGKVQANLNSGDVSVFRRAWINYHGEKGDYVDQYLHMRS